MDFTILDYLSCTEENEFRNCGRVSTCCCQAFKDQGLCPYMFEVIPTEDDE